MGGVGGSVLWRRVSGLSVAGLCAVALAGCAATDVGRPTVFPLEPGVRPEPESSLAPGAVSQVRLIYGPAPEGMAFTPIARIDSIAGRAADPSLRARQEEDLRRKAARVGADAVVEIRLGNIRSRGFISDPNTPFPAVRQGSQSTAFLRGVAVRLAR